MNNSSIVLSGYGNYPPSFPLSVRMESCVKVAAVDNLRVFCLFLEVKISVPPSSDFQQQETTASARLVYVPQ